LIYGDWRRKMVSVEWYKRRGMRKGCSVMTEEGSLRDDKIERV
jgi:hypothetical protein